MEKSKELNGTSTGNIFWYACNNCQRYFKVSAKKHIDKKAHCPKCKTNKVDFLGDNSRDYDEDDYATGLWLLDNAKDD